MSGTSGHHRPLVGLWPTKSSFFLTEKVTQVVELLHLATDPTQLLTIRKGVIKHPGTVVIDNSDSDDDVDTALMVVGDMVVILAVVVLGGG